MSLTVQNLRAVGPGVEPASLLPGQIAFNITNKVLFVGDGSNFKTQFNGTQVPAGVPGEGWYAMPMDFASLGDYYVANPLYYGDTPTDQQVLTWSTSLNHPIWTSGGGGGGGNQVYIVTNAQVASATGATLSDKITAAIGVASPDEGDVTIVTGLPDDVYEGLYFFTTEWVKGAAYAYPSATEVIYDNTAHPALTPTVQGAISDLDDGLIATTAIANTANSTANSALSIANAALPRSGGTMTGTIVSRNIDVPSTYSIQFDSGNAGTLNGISDSISSVSSTVAASSSSVRAAYQLAQAALPYAGGTMTGTITFTPGQIFPVSGIQDATTSQKGVVRVGTNIDVASGVISVKTASASQLGLVQVGSNIEVNGLGVISINPATSSALGVVQTGIHILNTAGVISVVEASTTTKGVVQLNDTATSTSTLQALTANQGRLLQNQINNLTIAGGVTLAGGFDPNIPAMESVTTAGDGVGFNVGSNLPLPATVSNYYVIAVADDSSYSPPGGGGPYSLVNGDWLLSDGVVWNYLGVGQRPASASYNQAGIVQLADCAATLAGTSDILAITPQSLCDITTNAVNDTCSRCLASALAVKTVNDTATSALPKAGGTMTGNITFQDAGEGIVFNGGSQLFAISDSTATTSSTTAASSTAIKAAYDLAAAAIPCATVSSLGDIISTNISGVPTALPLGLDGQVLVVNTACATGLEWVSDTPGDVTSVSGNAPIQVDNTDPQNPVVSIDAATLVSCGAVQLSDSLTNSSDTVAATASAVCTTYALADLANTTANAAIPCASFLAKGNLLGGTSTGNFSALSVGTNGQVLIADSACTTGLKWGNACYVPDACFTAAGQIIVGTGAGTYVALPVGTNCQTLVVNSACTATGGVTWGVSLTGYTCAAAVGNTALGVGAGDSITTGLHNTAVGSCAGTSISAGDNNTFVGWCTGDGLTSGNNNTAVGALAFGNTGGSNNTIMGYCAGAGITTGNSNTLVGSNAGDAIAGGNSIVGVGQGVLGGVVTAAGTVAIGATAGAALTSGANTTLVGFAAGDSITTGARNTVVGHTSGGAITTGADNTIIGALAGNLTTGTGSTILGSCAGAALTLGGANVFLGAGAGDLVTTGFNNTIIGDVGGSTTLQGNAILAAGTTIKFQANNSGAWSYNGTDFGTAGQFLASQGSAATPVWCTLSLACVPCSAFTAVGDILVGTGAATFSALPLGTSGQALVVDTACASGVKWITASGLELVGYTNTATPFNTALGSGAGDSITSGTSNVSVGFNAGTSITTGTNNTMVGRGAGGTVSTASEHTAVGFSAMALAAGSGGPATAVGAYALQCLTTGVRNTAVGYNAAGLLTTGACNTAVGHGALDTATGGNDNTAVGQNALTAVTSGNCNTAVGSIAAQSLTTGTDNVAVGYGALVNSATGSCNIAIGRSALSVVAGNANTAIGHRAGINLSSGTLTAVGSNALATVSTGTANVALGTNAGSAYTASRSVFIGHNAGDSATTGNSNVLIGADAGGTMTIGQLNILIGDTAGDAITAGSNNTILGDVAGSASLANNLILAAGSNIKIQVNENNALSIGPSAYGTAGQVLKSNGTGAAAAWSSAQYGAFSSSAIQTNADTTNGNAVTLNTVASSNGFSIVSGSQITATTAGVYNIQISLQVEKTDAGTDSVEVWFKKNGTNIANSNTNIQLEGNGAKQLFALNLVEPMTAGQYLEVWWYSADANVQLTSVAAGTRPAIPSAIVTVVPVGA